MKKLFGILVMLMITLSILGQNEGTYFDVLDKTSRTMWLIRKPGVDKINAYIDGDRSCRLDFEESQYSFIQNKKLYVVSYDTTFIDYMKGYHDGEMRTRELFLFSWDGEKWEIACDDVLQVDYRQNVNGINSQSTYHPWLDKGGSVTVEDNQTITIVLTTVYRPDLDTKVLRVYQNTVILTPSNDDMYHVSARGHQND